MKTHVAGFAGIVLLTLVSTLHAQVPQLINYQGRVAVGAVNFDGSGSFKFALVDTSGTTTYWSNDGTSTTGDEPTDAVALTVTKGLYSVLLGDTALTNMTAIPASVFTNADVRLRVWFNDGTNGSQLLTPDQRIAAVGYAMMAANVPDGAITGAKIAGGAVGTAQIAIGAITSTQLASGAVQSVHLSAGSVGSDQLATGAVDFMKLAKPPQAGTVNGSTLVATFGNGPFAVSFPQAYSTVPVVTTSLVSPSASAAVVNVTNVSVTGFSGMVSGYEPPSYVVDSSGNSGPDNSLVVVNGYPAIGYRGGANPNLKFVRATNVGGTAWGIPITLDGDGVNGESPSMGVVNGNPAICYCSPSNSNLRFVRANDPDGATWGSPITVDGIGTSNRLCALTVANGQPAICYTADNYTLKFVRATNPSGTTWGAPVTVSASYPFPPGAFSMAIVDGKPAIGYYLPVSPNGILKYISATDSNGSTWGAPITLDILVVGLDAISLALVSGNPAVSYASGGRYDLCEPVMPAARTGAFHSSLAHRLALVLTNTILWP